MYYTGPWKVGHGVLLPLSKENVMYSKQELVVIRKALVGMQKSVTRLANKEEQPDSVVAEYRKVYGEISTLIKHVEQDFVEQEAKEKLQAAAKKGV